MPWFGGRPKLSPLAERKLVQMVRNNQESIKALASHKLKAAGTLTNSEVSLALPWTAVHEADTFKCLAIRVKSTYEKCSNCYTWWW